MMKPEPYKSRAYAERVFWAIIDQYPGLVGRAPIECQRLLRTWATRREDGDMWDDMHRMGRCIATLGTGWKNLKG